MSMKLNFVNLKDLRRFCEVVFKPLFDCPVEGECAEIIYDNLGDTNYKNAHHVAIKDSTFDEFVKSLATVVDSLMVNECNVSIFPASIRDTDNPNGRAKRSGKSKACRAAAWIIELEPSKDKKIELAQKGLIPLDPSKRECDAVIRELLAEAAISLPKVIREAVKEIYVTGGGVNLVVQFAEPTKQIERASGLFKKIILDAKKRNPKLQIDESSAHIFHAQRLAGSLNWKYGGFPVQFLERDKYWFVDGKTIPFVPFNVDDMFIDYGLEHKAKNADVARNKYLETRGRINQYKKEISRDIIDEILRRVDFPTVFADRLEVVKEMPNYYLCRCPFHKPDHDPSFCVYKNLDSDGVQIGVDFHDDSSYDAIAFARNVYNIHDFRSALIFLAERVGMDLSELEEFGKERRKAIKQKAKEESTKSDLEEALEGEDNMALEWLKEVGVDPKSVRIETSEDLDKITFTFDVSSPYTPSGKVTIKMRAQDILNPDTLKNKLVVATVKEIEFPVEKRKEVKEFLRKIYTELVFLANENKAIEAAYSLKEHIAIQLIRYVERYYKRFIEYYAIFQNPEMFGFYFDEDNKLLYTTLFAFTKFINAAIHNANITTSDVAEAIKRVSFAQLVYEKYDGNRFPFIIIDARKFSKVLLAKYKRDLDDPTNNPFYKEYLKEQILLEYGELNDPEFWAEELKMDLDRVVELVIEARKNRLEQNAAVVAFGALMKETSMKMQELAEDLDKMKDKIIEHKAEFVNSREQVVTPDEQKVQNKKRGEPIANNEGATYFRGARINSSELKNLVESTVDYIATDYIIRDKELKADVERIRHNLDRIAKLEEQRLEYLKKKAAQQQSQASNPESSDNVSEFSNNTTTKSVVNNANNEVLTEQDYQKFEQEFSEFKGNITPEEEREFEELAEEWNNLGSDKQ